MGDKINRYLVINAAIMAIWKQKPAPGLIFHSDRGSQYCSKYFRDYIKGYSIKGSMIRKGNCWDNAVAESFFGSPKKERVYSASYRTSREAKLDIVDYIEMFYNCYRRHSNLGNLSPRAFAEKWVAKNRAA